MPRRKGDLGFDYTILGPQIEAMLGKHRIPEIGQKLGLRTELVYRYLRRNEIKPPCLWKIPTEDYPLLYELKQAGFTYKQIAEKWECSEANARMHTMRAYIMSRKFGDKNVDWSIMGPEVMRLSKEMTIPELAEQLKLHTGTVRNWFHKNNIPLPARGNPNAQKIKPEDYEIILELRRQKMKIKQIAEKWDVSEGTVYNALNRAREAEQKKLTQ